MAQYTKSAPKAVVGNTFNAQLMALAEHQLESAGKPGATDWYRPATFETPLSAIAEMHAPFSREPYEKMFEEAVTDANAPGTVGDLALVQLQGDFLHCLERAFRSRHHSACRTRLQPVGRLRGHGAETGVIRQGLLGYVVNVDRLNKGEQP